MAACESGSLAALKILVSAKGIDVNIKNEDVCFGFMEFFFWLEGCDGFLSRFWVLAL
jgi:hypothetical protein